MKIKIIYFLPLFIFLLLMLFFEIGLGKDPTVLPSTLIDKSFPNFSSYTLDQTNITQQAFKGKITLLNVWASWCEACQIEHPIWVDLANEHSNLKFVGLNYKDTLERARNFLTSLGDPYSIIIFDPQGKLAMQLGVYGTPETFIIDQQGIIRYRHVGYVTREVWEKILWPQIQNLENSHA